jgi:hypothetical protein
MYYDSHFTGGFQNKTRFLRKLHMNSEFQAARNIVGHSAFVNAIFHLAVEEKIGAGSAQSQGWAG